MAQRYAESKAIVLEPGVKTGMPILYENPKDVGPDRIADAVAAYDLYGGPTIVVDFGTGTTVEGVSAKGEYLGGSIMPGVEISLEALFGRTSLLHKAELVEPRSVIGKTTAESIQSGALYGFAAQVDGIVRRFEKEMGDSTVVATGGLSGLIVPFSETIDHHDPWLTLHGLRLIYQRNQSD
jgi:type III pantothenate kinase